LECLFFLQIQKKSMMWGGFWGKPHSRGWIPGSYL